MKTIKGQRLYELIEDSVALVVDVNGDGMICSQMNFMETLAIRYASCVPSNTSGREFMFRMRADQDVEINEAGQVLLVDDQTQDIFAVSLLNWTKVQPEGVESYTFHMKTVNELDPNR